MHYSHYDQMKNYIIEQYKGREFELIKEMPFMVSDIMPVTAEIRDWIVENSPEQMPLIPNCYINEKQIVKYTINMVKIGKVNLASNHISKDHITSYTSLAIILESGYFYGFKYEALSNKDKKRFFSSVLRLIKRKKLSNQLLSSLNYTFGLKVLDAFKDKTLLNDNLAYNLFNYLNYNYEINYKNIEVMSQYHNIIHSLYFFNNYNEEINESDNISFFDFKYNLYKSDYLNKFNILYNTGNDIFSKKQLKFNMSKTLKYILDKEGKLDVFFKKEGVVTIYKDGYLKEKLFGDFIKKFQLYIHAISDVNAMMNYTKYKTGELK